MYGFMLRMSRFMAVLGGLVLTALILLTCASILGRLLNTLFHGAFMQGLAPGFSTWILATGVGPVNGDYELVEAGVAFAIFAFLRMLVEIAFAAVLVLIAWRLYDGMIAKMRYGETSFLLQFPVWWAYAASLFGSVVAALVGVYMAAVRTVEFFTGRILVRDGAGADH